LKIGIVVFMDYGSYRGYEMNVQFQWGGGGQGHILHSIEMAVDKQYGGAEIRGRSGFFLGGEQH
jgi:hypothetical protein